MPARFLHTNRTQFKSLITKKRGDLNLVHWTDSENNILIDEALLTFGAASQMWKFPLSIKTEVGKSIYDLTIDTSINLPLIAFTRTFQNILDTVNNYLIESISETNLTSDLTSLEEFFKFARARINYFQYVTSLVLTKSLLTMPSPPVNELKVEDEVIDIIRAAFLSDNLYKKLREEDEQDLAFFARTSLQTTKNQPDFYTTALGSLNQLFLYPNPANLGQVELIYVNGIAASTELLVTTKVPLPNNLVPYIVFGICANILRKEGTQQDLARADYFEERFREGIELGKVYSSILLAYINGVVSPIDSLASLDAQQFNWQNTSGKPSLIGSAGFNIIATNKVPNDIYDLNLISITNAYLPTSDTDWIDVKPEYIQVLADYVVHLGMIKEGIFAIKSTDSYRNAFIQLGVGYNLRLLERGQTFEKLMRRVKLQQDAEPLAYEVKQKQVQNA